MTKFAYQNECMQKKSSVWLYVHVKKYRIYMWIEILIVYNEIIAKQLRTVVSHVKLNRNYQHVSSTKRSGN